MDIRVWASIGAALLLIAGVMWTIPTTPDSNNFKFDTVRRGISQARPIEIAKPMQGKIVDGSDTDLYRIDPAPGFGRLEISVHIDNGTRALILGLTVYDAAKKTIAEKSEEYLHRPGADLEYSFAAQPDMTYYLQVWSQRNTAGAYTLTVTTRTP